MAYEYTGWAWSQPINGSGCKFILVALADSANADGYSYPGQQRLAAMTGQSDRAVRRHLDWLEENGYLQREERRRADGTRTSDGYRLPPLDPSTGQIGRWPTGQIGHLSTGQNGQLQASSPEPRPARENPPMRATGQNGHLTHQPARLAGHEPKDLELNTHTSTPSSSSSPSTQLLRSPRAKMGQSEIPLNRLINDHPAVWQQLVFFRDAHDKPVPGRQFAAWAESVLEDVRQHGEQVVDEALETAIESFSQLEWPFQFYRGVVKRLLDNRQRPPSKAPEQPRSGESGQTGIYAQAGLAELVSRAKEGML